MKNFQAVVTNLTDLHKGPSFLDEMFTQLVNGAVVEILEEQEKWARVREEGGYEGWMLRTYLAPAEKIAATHLVIAPVTRLYSEPSEAPAPIACLHATTAVAVKSEQNGWSRVGLTGSILPAGWVRTSDLRALSQLPISSDAARVQIIADARRMTGTYYLWGGNTAWGTDCSGLAMMTHRLAGYTLPRDAWMQHRDAKKIETARAGDLFFFHNDARTKIGHVGICTGGWNMIHSSRSRNGVYEEDIQKNETLRAGFAGAGTFLD